MRIIAIVVCCVFAVLQSCNNDKTTIEEAPVDNYSQSELTASIEKNNEAISQATSPDSIIFISRNQLTLCEQYIEKYDTAQNAAIVLAYGAKAARASQQHEKAVKMYSRIINSYPAYPEMAEVMFLKAFILDQEIKQKDRAKEAYTALMTKYPEHPFSKDAEVLVSQLYMSDEEMIQWLQEKNKAKAGKNNR